MTYSEYIQVIAESNIDDWKYDDERVSYLYLPNISIMMKGKDVIPDEDGEWRKKFEESWAETFIKPEAYVHVIELYYDGMRIDDFYTAIVDGTRMCIPYPQRPNMTITKNQYNVGRIINIPYCVNDVYKYDEYLKQVGITVKND